MLADFSVLRQRSYRYLFLSQTISLLGGMAAMFIAHAAPLSVVIALAAVNGCAAALFLPASKGVIPQIVAAGLGPLLARQDMGGAPAWAAVLTAMAVGLVSGSLVAMRLHPRFPLRTAAAATFGFLPPFFLLAFHAPVWLVAASMLVNGVCVDMIGSFVLGPLGLLAVGPVSTTLAGPQCRCEHEDQIPPAVSARQSSASCAVIPAHGAQPRRICLNMIRL